MRSLALAPLGAAPAVAAGAVAAGALAAGAGALPPALVLGVLVAALLEALAGLAVGAAALEVCTPGSTSCARAACAPYARHSVLSVVINALMSSLRDRSRPLPEVRRARAPRHRG